MQLSLDLALSPVRQHVGPLPPPVHVDADPMAALHNRFLANFPNNLIVLRPHLGIELADGPVDGVQQLVVGLVNLVLVPVELVELGRADEGSHGEIVGCRKVVFSCVVPGRPVPGVDPLHEYLGLYLYRLSQVERRVPGDVSQLEHVVNPADDVSVDVHGNLVVETRPHPSLEQQFSATYALSLEVVAACPGPFFVFVKAEHRGGGEESLDPGRGYLRRVDGLAHRALHLVRTAGRNGQSLVGRGEMFVFSTVKTSAAADFALLSHVLRAVVTRRVPQDDPVHCHLSGVTVRQYYPTDRQNLFLYF